jgi:hypothetical protein
VTGTPVVHTAPSSHLDTGDDVSATVSCASGKVVFGGGYTLSYSSSSDEGLLTVRQSYPSAAGTWTVVATYSGDMSSGHSVTLTPYALCSQ